MYTPKVTVYRSESFTVISYGNGAAYAVDDHVREASFFIQDEEGVQVIDQALDNTESIDDALNEFVGYFDPTEDDMGEYLATYEKVRYG